MSNKIIDLKTEAIKRIYSKYPPIDIDEMPVIYEIHPIEYRKHNIEEYEVVFWHRLLKSIYNKPHEIEVQYDTEEQDQESISRRVLILRKTQKDSEFTIINIPEVKAEQIDSGEIKLYPCPINWRYFIRLPEKGIMVIKTVDCTTKIICGFINAGGKKNIAINKEAERYISILLDEASKRKNSLFNPAREFESSGQLKTYNLLNVYLANYRSAMSMLETALIKEKQLCEEVLRYDARDLNYWDEYVDKEKKEYLNYYLSVKGAYFLSAITYFYFALEGFINIIYHSFLKSSLGGRDINIEQRLDIELKIRMMPVLCSGFGQVVSFINQDFVKLRKYRNCIVHSKLDDSLKGLALLEDGFIYHYDMSKHKGDVVPINKMNLSANDVIEVKNIVDEMVNQILSLMEGPTRERAERYILKSAEIPFFISDEGVLTMGIL